MNFVLKKITALIICSVFVLSAAIYSGTPSSGIPGKIFETKQSFKKADNSKNNNLEEVENDNFFNVAKIFSSSFKLLSQKPIFESHLPLGFVALPPFSPPNA